MQLIYSLAAKSLIKHKASYLYKLRLYKAKVAMQEMEGDTLMPQSLWLSSEGKSYL